jgi:hypothetical protein
MSEMSSVSLSVGCSSIRLSEQRALKRTGKLAKLAAISAILLCHFRFHVPFQRVARLDLRRNWQAGCRRQDC